MRIKKLLDKKILYYSLYLRYVIITVINVVRKKCYFFLCFYIATFCSFIAINKILLNVLVLFLNGKAMIKKKKVAGKNCVNRSFYFAWYHSIMILLRVFYMKLNIKTRVLCYS